MSSEPTDQHELSSPVKQFCSYTSAHGLGRFVEQSSFIGRSLWLTFLLATYSGFGYHLYTLFDRYQQAPVLTTITVSTLPYQFPDVYICPTHAVTMSRIVPMLSQRDIYNVEHVSKSSNPNEKIKLYEFDLSAPRRFYLNMPTYAFLRALEVTEQTMIDQLQPSKNAKRGYACRTSLNGEEYIGNASSAAVYGVTSFSLESIDYRNTAGPPVPPYIAYRQCMRWNDAARMLQRGSSNAEVLGGLLMKLNFSETESRCRSTPGLPLTEFLPIATRPRREIIGCFPVTADTLNAFNITCYSGGLEAFEPCAQCCDKFNAPFAALLNRGDCLCGSSEAAATLADGSWTSCDRQCGNSKTEPCGSDRTAAVMIIRDVEDKPMHIGRFGQLEAYSGGPYCFFMDSERLNAGLCDVPYCAATKEFDCAVSKNAGANVVYTGRTNWTESGRDCLPWSSVENVQMKMKLNKGVRFVEKLLRLKIQTPDRIGNTSDNFCRPVSIVIDLAETENGTFTRHPVLISNSPVCFADPSLLHTMSVPIFQTQFFEMAFERCTIPTCSAETSVRGVFTDSVGSHLLARQFSNDLSIGLADCTFAGQKCTKEHFVNIDHPQLGMCHQFLKQSFIANMSSTQLAGSQLSITYFTDSTDSKGKTVEDMPEMTSAFHNGMSLEISDLAFKAIIVPEDSFPWSSKGIDVAASQRMDVQLRFERYSRLSTASRPCLETTEPIVYRLPSWKKSMSNEDLKMEEAAELVGHSGNWSEMIRRLRAMLLLPNSSSVLTATERQFNVSGREDCINSYIVQQFIENCNCLPSILPVKVDLFDQYSYCFDAKDIGNLSIDLEIRYNEQVSRINQYEFEAMKRCQSPCRTDGYSVRYVTYPWPNLKTARSTLLLQKLASNYGYRTSVSGLRGVANFYQAYLKSLSLTGVPFANQSAKDILGFEKELESLQNRLARLTVQAWTSEGQEITEEEAYPTKNLVADIGGALGLWSGVSILTVCEVVELLIYISQRLAAKLRQRPSASEGCSAAGSNELKDSEVHGPNEADIMTAF